MRTEKKLIGVTEPVKGQVSGLMRCLTARNLKYFQSFSESIKGVFGMTTELLLPTLSEGVLSITKFTVSTRWLKCYLAIHFKRFDKFTQKKKKKEVHKIYKSATARNRIITEEVLI